MLKKSVVILLFAFLAATAFAVQAKTITIQGTDSMRFKPNTFTVKPGEKVTVKLVNKTKLPPKAMSHTFMLLKNSTDPKAFNKKAMAAGHAKGYFPKSKADETIAHTGLVSGGESDSVTFTAPD